MSKKKLNNIYVGIEIFNNYHILYNNYSEPSVIIEVQNIAQQYCADEDSYNLHISIYDNIIKSLGEGYLLQKQDIFSINKYDHKIKDSMSFLSKSYFQHFKGRKYIDIHTYLIITQKIEKKLFVHDIKKLNEFILKIEKVISILDDKNIPYYVLDKEAIKEYIYRFQSLNFTSSPPTVTNFSCTPDCLKLGEQKVIKSFSLIDIDLVELPHYLSPINYENINGYDIPTDIVSWLSTIPYCDCVIYNQTIQIPFQRKLIQKLNIKAKRHSSLPDASNQYAESAINELLDSISQDSKLLVYTNFNILIKSNQQDINKSKSYIETKLFDAGILISQSSYNQLELYLASFPGNSYRFADYDLFLTLSETALCLTYKEHRKQSEITSLTTYYTDRYGVPVAIDITGKEGKIRLTDNANFFCIGPSGSGKSFHMNSVVRQLLEQNTDIILVDTGDSYEGICRYYKGTYITYSKEKPISMNPFKITDLEYKENFDEKKQFLKNLIFLIFKGNVPPTKSEESIIEKIIVEYYDSYFNDVTLSSTEREIIKQKLLLQDKKNGLYDYYYDTIEEKIEQESKQKNISEKIDKLHNIINDEASSQGEKDNANAIIHKLMPELIENKYLVKIEERIDRIEKNRKRMKVKNLSFNSFYEYSIERIPQIMEDQHVEFDIHNYAIILERFYKGGELSETLNNDVDSSLFDEKMIVFEIDKIKDNPVLFPIVVLIIMDVFIQKMRLKKGRKALIIEEAWKAISSPTMAEYIKYLYKTVRKFHGIAGVVTQEITDVIDSPIVKEAIINNSDIKILLDQSKFKERYDEIAAILGLTDVQKRQIFTINSLDNGIDRPFFKEVWIARGQYSDVYGVEEAPECYWAYTTERTEKECLKIYEKHYQNIELAITQLEADRKKLNLKYLEFAKQVVKNNKIC